MKYISVNRLNDFEFHDAEMKLIRYADGRLTVSMECLNIHKGTEQNPHPTDMEIECAQLTFDNFSLSFFDPGNVWSRDADGKWSVSEELKILTDAEAEQKLLCELKERITIFTFEPFDDTFYYIDGGSWNEPWFAIRFTFDSVTIEWDAYRKIAWYEEDHRRKN